MTLLSAGVLVYEAALLIGGSFPFYGAPAIELVRFEPGFWMSAAGAAVSLAGAIVLLGIARRGSTTASAHTPARETGGETGAMEQSAS